MRESVVYVLLFLLIVGAGVVLIVPRLMRAPGLDEVPGADRPSAPEPLAATPDESAAAAAGERVRPLIAGEALALPRGVEVVVTGVEGPLVGPLAAVVGADVRTPVAPDAREVRLLLDATATRVAFGAVGHEWVWVAVGDLVSGMRVALPRAAPPLVVRVREADGSPAVDVPAVVRPASPLGSPRTDAGGTIVIDYAPAGLVTVDLTTSERAGPSLRLRAGPDDPADRDVTAVLEPVWMVIGRVVDPDGTPVEGAQVDGFARTGRWGRAQPTDVNGRFLWEGRPTAVLALRFRPADLAEIAVEVSPPCVGALRSDIGVVTLSGPGVSIECRVESMLPTQDGTGATAVAAYVEIEPQAAAIVREVFGHGLVLDEPRRKSIGSDGVVRFDGLPPQIPLRVSVRGAGVPNDAVVTGSSGETHRLTLSPRGGHVIAGFIRTPDGDPVSGIQVILSRGPRDGDRAFSDDRVATTGANGAFQRFGLPGDTAYLRAYVPGYRSLLRRIRLPLTEPLEFTLEPVLVDADRRLAGVVLDEAGVPLEGVTLRAAGVSTESDATGRFLLDGVESLAPTVMLAFGFEPGALPEGARHPRPFVRHTAVDVTPGVGGDLELVLPYSAKLTLEAVDGVDAEPLSFVHVVVRLVGGRLIFDRGVAPIDGRIEIDGLAVRDGHVTVPRQTLSDGTVRVVPQPRSSVRVGLVAPKRRAEIAATVDEGVAALGEVLLAHGMRIAGRVVNKRGVPVAGALVAGMDAGWQSRSNDVLTEREVTFRTVRTDAEGRFVLEGFDPKRPADLAVWAPGHAPAAERVLLPPFSDDLSIEIEVMIEEGGHVLLLLQDEGTKRPIDGALMDLEHARDGADHLDLVRAGVVGGLIGSTEDWLGASEHFLFADHERGTYAIGPLRPGPYEIWIERPGYQPLRRKITVFARGENVFDPYAGTSRSVLGNHSRMVFLMHGAD